LTVLIIHHWHQKKSPAFASKTGDFTRMDPSQSYPRRPLSEGYPSRFSDSPDLNSPSHAIRTVAFLLRHLPRKYEVGTTAAGPSPIFPLIRDHGVPFTWISPIEFHFI
jgi:hypothetical protein